MYRILPIPGLLLLLLFTQGVAANNLPDLGDPSLKNFSSSTEKRYGELFYQALRSNVPFVDDEQLNHYITSLGQKLLTHSDATQADFKFFIVESGTINAFAGPDAHIGINSGLVLRAHNESELASVMAHEIAHVSQRHLARMFSKQDNATALSIAAIMAAILVGSQSPDAAQALIATGVAGSYQTAINYTRQHEYEADRIGIGILAKAGIDPRGMVGFFRTLLEESQGSGIEYLRTHPLNINRVSEAEDRIQDAKLNGHSDSEDFRFARVRLQVLTSDDPRRLLLPVDQLSAPHLVYRQALVLTQLDDTGEAISLLETLRGRSKHPWVSLALADALQRSGQPQAAVELLRSLLRLYPGYLPVTFAYTRLSMDSEGDMQEVITLLKHQLQTDNKAGVHELLARAYFQNGQIAAALESTGNQYLLQGYIELALQQYENASKQPGISETTLQRLQTRINLLKD